MYIRKFVENIKRVDRKGDEMTDLHLHLDGSLNPKNMDLMAEMSGIKLPFTEENELKKQMMIEPACKNLGEYLEKFELPLQVLQTKECLEYAVHELLKEVYAQGLCYAEIRFAPQLHQQRDLTQKEVVESAIKGLEKAKKEFPIEAQLILCCMRGDTNHVQNLETVEVAKEFTGQGVCAVDLAGNEAAYPTRNFEDLFLWAREQSVPIIIHAGEAAGAESVEEALACGAVRIGHGIHSIESPELLERLKAEKIYLELCYSSNLQTQAVKNPKEYPLVEFLKKGILVTVNTDNMTVSNTSLKREYQLLKETFQLSEETLLQLAENSVEAAFLPKEKKLELKQKVKQGFLKWLNAE